MMLRRVSKIELSKKAKVYFFAGLFAVVIVLTTAVYNATFRSFEEGEVEPEFAASLKPPINLKTVPTDHTVVLNWEKAKSSTGKGFQVVWGPVESPEANKQMTEYASMQIQPLENSKSYTAKVRSIDSLGVASAYSAPIAVKADPSRVTAQKQASNFFDDFNLPAGAVDEKKWNSGYSYCDVPALNGSFVNSQFHVHNMFTQFQKCYAATAASRARTPIVINDNQTSFVEFDVDGMVGNQVEDGGRIWYLYFSPERVDIVRWMDLARLDSFSVGYPAKMPMVVQRGKSVSISVIDAENKYQAVATGEINDFDIVPNVRRRWRVEVGRQSMKVIVNGKVVVETTDPRVRMDKNVYHLISQPLVYDGTKGYAKSTFFHWDNVSLGGPKKAGVTDIITHNYVTAAGGNEATRHGVPVTIKLPDSTAGASSERLMFTLQMQGFQSFDWQVGDRLIFNGQEMALPEPVSGSDRVLDSDRLVDFFRPYPMTIDLPLGTLKTGDNVLEFRFVNHEKRPVRALNIHTEVDFLAGNAPAYTPPKAIFGSPSMVLPEIGASVVIRKIGSHSIGYANHPAKFARDAAVPVTLTGTVPIKIGVNHRAEMFGTGGSAGTSLVELWVDKKVVASYRTDKNAPAPAGNYTFELDTSKLDNGSHEIYVVAYSPTCVPGIVTWIFGAQNGKYQPLFLRTNNPSPKLANYPVSNCRATLANPARAAVVNDHVVHPELLKDEDYEAEPEPALPVISPENGATAPKLLD